MEGMAVTSARGEHDPFRPPGAATLPPPSASGTAGEETDQPAASTSPQDPLINTPTGSPEGQRLLDELQIFFMNPFAKYSKKGAFPYNFSIQLVKIILVTLQLVLFGKTRSEHVDFLEKSNIAFNKLYLKDWDPSIEPEMYAVYEKPQFFDTVNHVLRQYNRTDTAAIGNYDVTDEKNEKVPVYMCHTSYNKSYTYKNTYEYDAHKITECLTLGSVNECNKNGTCSEEFDVKTYLNDHADNFTLDFNRVINVTLTFTVSTIHHKGLTRTKPPDCFNFTIKIRFDNAESNGQMVITLTSPEERIPCNGTIKHHEKNEDIEFGGIVLLDVVVIAICICSFSLCARSLYIANKLRQRTVEYFKQHMNRPLSYSDHFEFLNLWYLLIVMNDIFTISGSIFKMSIEMQMTYHYKECGVLLGTGNLLVWIGVLRYLGTMQYNIVLLTMKKSAPNVLRFLLCATVFYLGFAVCGFVVLGPYHPKFRYLTTTMECLFSLVNGDDMFPTFSVIDDNDPSYIWWFSRVYLYTFISLFIYVILNLFTAVIIDAYEALKKLHADEDTPSPLDEFVKSGPDLTSAHDINLSNLCRCCLLCRLIRGRNGHEHLEDRI